VRLQVLQRPPGTVTNATDALSTSHSQGQSDTTHALSDQRYAAVYSTGSAEMAEAEPESGGTFIHALDS